VAAHALFALAALALAAAGIAYAWLWMFSNFQLYDDEGYFLVLVRHLLDGRRIYDDVTTAYGPAWLGYRWVLNGLLGAPLTTDGVRFESLGAWIVCALLAGVLVRQATRGQPLARWCALGASAFALLQLSVFANEPGHPQDLAQLVFLGGLALFLALRERRPLAAAALLGLAIGAQGWTKVNLGVFFALPAALLCLAGNGQRLARACALLLPWLLMRTHLAQPWAPALASVVDCGLLAAWIFQRPEPETGRRRQILGLCGGVALATLGCVGFALARGSTLAGLWHALVVLPSRFTSEIVIGIRVPGSAAFVAPAALALALFVRARGARLPAWALPAAELGFGAFTLFCVAPHPEWMIPYALPFAWVVLARAETRAARLPLVLCAPLQALQVFPVSGSQEALGTILLVPLAAIALADACAALARTGSLARTRRVCAGLLAALLVLHGGLLLAGNAHALSTYWGTEEERVALPGVRWTRFEEATGGRARFLADTLRGSFDDFLSVRGDASQYAWTGIAPATGVIVSHSWRLFDERQQAELASAYERAPRALLLDNINPERIPPELRARLPFFLMLQRVYRPVARIGADELCVAREAAAPRLASCAVLPESALRSAGARLELHWPPAPVEGTQIARVQIANRVLRSLFADSAVADARFHPRLWDGTELLFDGTTHPRVTLERLALARDLRLELPQPLPPKQASFISVRFFGPDGARVLSLPVVIALHGP
jgi:hypothetical protein